MKLYYSPLACSLADHIALHEAGMAFEIERVDLRAHRTEHGVDFHTISAKGYVPALILDDGEMITENVAVLDWIADQSAALAVPGALGRTRTLEALTYITTEIHRAYKPMWHGGSEDELAASRAHITGLLQPLADTMSGDYLLADQPSVADFYLFVMLLWAKRFAVDVPAPLAELRERMLARPAVIAAMQAEGLA